MKKITYQDIVAWGPCYGPSRYMGEEQSGTAIDVLNATHVPAEDRLWVVLREEVLDARTLRLFAVSCARRALGRVSNPDPRSVAACHVAERYANGETSEEEMAKARAAAKAAARAAARAAAWAEAWAARVAAKAEARAAAREWQIVTLKGMITKSQ